MIPRTKLMRQTILAIAENFNHEQPDDAIYSDELFDSPLGDFVENRRRLSGTVAALSRKGFVECLGQGRSSQIKLTEKGLRAYHEIKALEASNANRI